MEEQYNMIKNYKDLFRSLNKGDIKYAIFKGIDHLSDDLFEGKGDIDLIINKKDIIEFDLIAKKNGFFKTKGLTKVTNKYYSLDLEKKKLLMLDVFFELPLWINKHSNITLKVNLDDMCIDRLNFADTSIQILSEEERYIHNRLYYLLKENSDTADKPLFESIKLNNEFSTSSLGKAILAIGLIRETVASKKDAINELKEKTKLINGLSFNKLQITDLFARKVKRGFGFPANPSHSGMLVAFVGVDGAGKSTLIDQIISNTFFQSIGIKRIYFGHNEFRIPFILKLYKLLASSPKLSSLRVFPAVIMNVERRFRLLKANYFIKMGNIVVCDRYFYDDEVYYRDLNTQNSKGMKGFFEKFLRMRVKRIPDLTFYLDVSPDVAYSRKQDFSYEQMKEVNSNYKNYIRTKDEVTFINADGPPNAVYSSVVEAMFSNLLLRRKC